MKVLYVVGFEVKKATGRAQGANNKRAVLDAKMDECKFYSADNRWLMRNKLILRYPRVRRVLSYILLNLVIFKELIKSKYDVIIIRDVIGAFVIPFGLFRSKTILEVHGIPWEESGGSNKYVLGLYRYLFELNLKIFDGVIFNHPALDEYFSGYISMQSTYVYNGGEFRIGNCELVDYSSRSKVIFSYCGNIRTWHGVEFIKPILDGLMKEKVNFEFNLVGGESDEYAESVRSIYETESWANVIRDSGKDTLNKYIAKSDFCFLPVNDVRTSPGNPIKMFEYLNFGRRIITQQDCRGYSDLLSADLDPILIDFHSPAEAAISILSEIKLKASLEDALIRRKLAKDRFSWENTIQQWFKFIDKL